MVLLGACTSPGPAEDPRPLSQEAVLVTAQSWHLDLCLTAAAIGAGRLAPLAQGSPTAQAFAFGFGLESWMRAARPGSGEALGALAGGPAVVAIQALPGPAPVTAEESVALRLPYGGHAAIDAFIAGQLEVPLPPVPPGGSLLLPSRRRYSLRFTCNSWVMAALAAAGLPVPVSGVGLRREAMAALRVEAARQAGRS